MYVFYLYTYQSFDYFYTFAFVLILSHFCTRSYPFPFFAYKNWHKCVSIYSLYIIKRMESDTLKLDLFLTKSDRDNPVCVPHMQLRFRHVMG